MKFTLLEELRVFGVVAVAPLVEHVDAWTLGPLIVQIPLLGVSVLQNFGAVTADRALRSRLFRVRVGLRAQLQLSTSFSTFDRKKLNKNRRLRALRPP